MASGCVWFVTSGISVFPSLVSFSKNHFCVQFYMFLLGVTPPHCHILEFHDAMFIYPVILHEILLRLV